MIITQTHVKQKESVGQWLKQGLRARELDGENKSLLTRVNFFALWNVFVHFGT